MKTLKELYSALTGNNGTLCGCNLEQPAVGGTGQPAVGGGGGKGKPAVGGKGLKGKIVLEKLRDNGMRL